ncbi:SLAP domain-containing protein [Bacillus sp. REN16]|uniref:SLAP domain-containing protein n=1 Tax=Bacillus sp. REN16 TaxID=2887296 RepID=UPI001E5B6812|nr:SLAP domain-containing protein [Bacillus sp. REN16]MCC3357010.1 SLAP domain-containing protein [Bacillus sp. REN16]
MQILVFEDAWDRTISPKDREKIEHIFYETVADLDAGVTFTTIWIATNHKNEQLVTAIIHNKTTQNLIFENTLIEVWSGDNLLANQKFTLPTLYIPPETSMPWTFIFPAGFEVPDSATLRLKKEK